MSDQIKYTNDGKKVRVVGKLNSKETIVQEIFVQGGNEIPSGENFVVKSLHDEPSVSWKEKNLQEIEERYHREKDEYNKLIRELKNRRLKKRTLVENKLQFLQKFIDNSTETFFDDLKGFLLDEFKYIVKENYNPEIIEFKEKNDEYDGKNLSLISLYGNDDGTLNWERSRYSDGSGLSSTIHPCRTLGEAKEKLTEFLRKRDKYSSRNVAEAEKWGIKLDQNKLADYVNGVINSKKDAIQKRQKEADSLQHEINDIKIKYEGL